MKKFLPNLQNNSLQVFSIVILSVPTGSAFVIFVITLQIVELPFKPPDHALASCLLD